MQPAQNWLRGDTMAVWQHMPIERCRYQPTRSLRDTGSEGRVRTSPIVMADEFTQEKLQVVLSKRNQKIEAFPPEGADQPFAVGVGLGSPNRRSKHVDAEVS